MKKKVLCRKVSLAVSKWQRAWPDQNTKHFIEFHIHIGKKNPIHTGELVFLRVYLDEMNLFLAFPDKIRHFGAFFGIFFSEFWAIFCFLVTILVLQTFWAIITLDLVWVILSGQKNLLMRSGL